MARRSLSIQKYRIIKYQRNSWQQSNSTCLGTYLAQCNANWAQGKHFFLTLQVPDIYLSNDKKAYKHEITRNNQMLRLQPDGMVYYGLRYQLTCLYAILSCNFSSNFISKLPWAGDSEGIFRISIRTVACLSVNHTRWKLYTVPFNVERKPGSCEYQFFIFCLTWWGTELQSTGSVADALSTWSLVGKY